MYISITGTIAIHTVVKHYFVVVILPKVRFSINMAILKFDVEEIVKV